MPARFLFRTISVILIAFLLLSAVPPAASGQAPEPPRPERFERLRDRAPVATRGVLPQAPDTQAPLRRWRRMPWRIGARSTS